MLLFNRPVCFGDPPRDLPKFRGDVLIVFARWPQPYKNRWSSR